MSSIRKLRLRCTLLIFPQDNDSGYTTKSSTGLLVSNPDLRSDEHLRSEAMRWVEQNFKEEQIKIPVGRVELTKSCRGGAIKY